jgi:hypothetical protein
LKSDKTFVLKVVSLDGISMQYADKKLQNDKEIALAAMKETVGSIQLLDRELLNDKEFIMEALNQSYIPNQDLDSDSDSDTEIMNEILKEGPTYFLDELQYDQEVIWMSKHYFKIIKKIEFYNLNFKFI